MLVRIKFIKTGSLKFVGHLDLLRYFQKAFRRGKIDVSYSQGFNPHQLITFAAPLGVGLTSEGEYLDVRLNSTKEPEVMIEKINQVMANDIQVINFQVLPDNSKNAMSIVAGADYVVSLKDGYDFLKEEEFREKFIEFYNQDNIRILKKTKKSEKEIDIKPLIYQFGFYQDEYCKEEKKDLYITNNFIEHRGERYENGLSIYLKLATGSANNLKPELVMEAFCRYAEIPYNPFAFQVHRLEIYKEYEEDNNKLVPLDYFATED